MSDIRKIEDSTMETQDTYYENSKDDINNSQDFQLVDTDETDVSKNKLETQSETDNLKNKDDCNVQENKSLKDIVVDEARSNIEDKSEIVSDDKVNTEEDSCKLDNQKDDTDDENDIIQGTPPDMFSSPKKEVHDRSENVGLKRKLDSTDNSVTKFLRSSPLENALSLEKSKFHSNDSQQSNESDDSQPNIAKSCMLSDVVIEETQDVEGEEFIESSKKTSDIILNEAKDDQNCESCPVQKLLDKNENNANTICEINQNETINNPTTSYTATNVTTITTVTTTTTATDTIATISTTSTTPTTSTIPATTSSTNNTDEENTSDVLSMTIRDEKELSETQEISLIDITGKNNLNSDTSDSSKQIIEQESSTSSSKKDDKSSTSKDINDDVNLELKKNINEEIVVDESTVNTEQPVATTYLNKSRKSIEVVYDKATMQQNKKIRPTLVEIDEDGEKIILDSSEENYIGKIGEKEAFDTTNTTNNYRSCYDNKTKSDFSYKPIVNNKESSVDLKSDKHHFNGSSECKKSDTDGTASIESDTFNNELHSTIFKSDNNLLSLNKEIKISTSGSKKNDHTDLISISDNEHDISLIDDNSNSKSELNNANLLTKALQVEREVGVYVRLKCSLHFDESTKEILNKELTSVHCEPIAELSSLRLKPEDASASLADISGNDNKDNSPGSVNSNPQLFQLIPSRLSLLSSVSSSSSASSAASLIAKLVSKDPLFSLPRGPAKHAKKTVHESSASQKQNTDELYEKLTKEWKNNRLLLTAVLNYLNTELNMVDPLYSLNNERLDDGLQKLRCSTPEDQGEKVIQTTTPKSSRKNRAPKRSRCKSNRTGVQSNGDCKIPQKDIISTQENNDTPISKKKNKIDKTDSDAPSNTSTVSFTKDLSYININDELVGKEVFAKWSDNNYYPGIVTEKSKLKYKVNFYDGKNKLLIEDFIIPIPKTLENGLSIYATTAEDDYGSCAVIVTAQYLNNDLYYLVSTDDEKIVKVQIKDIFLSSDQAAILRESCAKINNLPTTPKISGQISLDNMVHGKRRSKRIATPTMSTPKSKIFAGCSIEKNIDISEPSVSGIPSKTKKIDSSENESKSSDSNLSVKDESLLSGIQPEIVGTPNEQIVKGPQHRIKGKSRSKKKVENEEIVAILGPIPNNNSTLFKGMSFILTCASLEVLDRFRVDNKDSGSETGTENEEEWVRRPFVRDRLKTQIETAKGKIYDDFDLIPKEEYKNTKLITNVPNTTAKNLLCLSVGISAYNHNWIIQCCQKNTLVNPSEFILPAGWSLEKESYIENFQRPNTKPLNQVIVIIPIIETDKKYTSFWRQICENAGAVVLLVDGSESMEGFAEGTVVVTNHRCPSWAVTKADKCQLPLLSTTWVTQCLIEGKICAYNSHPRYKYNYM
ncbi:serine-rich adhesin for platelets-like [Polistes fuscatus]|uniref:serine-rich adhesin for platelets-like n=1 Tax=Polistes fuscatus TaxID=30207 RepID=UPI001CA9AFDD|nr:serine-rich adhesin for platelets-like [Polistes fuscatus]